MKVLVAYATRHGATQGIAKCIASTLEQRDLEVTLSPVELVHAGSLIGFDGFVLGSAAYMGRWLGAMTDFVRRNADLLAHRPLYLFSSGPVGADRVDAKGKDVLEQSRPREFDEFAPSLHPKDVRVFFGAFDPDRKPKGIVEVIGSAFLRLPATRKALQGGDFRDWPAIEAWAGEIACQLTNPAARTGPDAATRPA